MKIDTIRLQTIRIPLNFRFEQANNRGTRHSLSAILSIRTQDGISGYGEACPRTYVTGERVEDLVLDLERLRPELIDSPITSIEHPSKGSVTKTKYRASHRPISDIASGIKHYKDLFIDLMD